MRDQIQDGSYRDEDEESYEAKLQACLGLDKVIEPEVIPYIELNMNNAREIGFNQNGYTVGGSNIGPRMEQAVRLYACGKYSAEQVAKQVGCAKGSLIAAWNSPQGQAIADTIRGDLENRFQGLYSKVIDVLGEALDHDEPSVALAAASLWLKSGKAKKVEVSLTAEDLVQRIMSGGV